MKCKCIANEHGNTNFSVGKKYEFTTEGRIKTNLDMWTKHYETFKIENNVFECGMCRFQVIIN